MVYKDLEVLGPEHEFSIVSRDLKPQPVSDMLIKRLSGRIKNSVQFKDFILGKELQKHVIELKPTLPFVSPDIFEETMESAVNKISNVLEKMDLLLLGGGMHPTLNLEETRVWDHRDRRIYEAFNKIFGIKQHGWLNIQSYQLNLPYEKEHGAIRIYNALSDALQVLPAISAASPILELEFGDFLDNRLHHYKICQNRIPSITGDIIPEPIDSFRSYRRTTIEKYSQDLAIARAPPALLGKEWINSRGAIIRFDRKAIEIRIMDEQECIKTDVALSSFIRAFLRGILIEDCESFSSTRYHNIRVRNLNNVVRKGLEATISHPDFNSARDLCLRYYKIAYENAFQEEKKYLQIIKKRIETGNLSQVISRKILGRLQKTDMNEAIMNVYSRLANCLIKNEPFW